MTRVAVVGGGLAGLTAATTLRDLARARGTALELDVFDAPPDGYGFLVAPGEAPRILGALFESNLFPGRAPADHVLVRVILGGVDRPEVATADEDELVADARAALAAALGPVGEPVQAWVRRPAGAIPQYRLGHQARVARIDGRLRRTPGVHLVGSAYRGVAVGSIVEEAQAIAERVCASARMSSAAA